MSGFDEERLDALPPSYEEAIEEFREYKNRTCKPTTVTTYLNRACNFCEFLDSEFDEFIPLSEVGEFEHAEAWHSHLLDTKSRTNTKSHVITVREFFERLERRDWDVDSDVWFEIEEEQPSETELRDRTASHDDASVAETARALMNVRHPMWYGFIMLMLKTTMRVGATINLKLGHVHLHDPDAYRIYDDLGVEYHHKIKRRPDTIWVEREVLGTKRKVSTVIPIGPELKTALLRALAVRPTTPASLENDQRYFFTSMATNYGLKQSTSNVSNFFHEQFVAPNDCIPDAMTPHDCRHWSYRQMKATPNPNRVLIEYIKGAAGDLEEHYNDLTADYDRRVRREYLRHVPMLFDF